MKTTLNIFIGLALLLTCACNKKEPPAKQIKIAANLSPAEITYLEMVLRERTFLPQTKIIIEPAQGMDPKNLLIGNNQPDIFELGYNQRIPLFNSSVELHKMLNESQRSAFGIGYFTPGQVENRKFYYMPFRMSWPAFFYNTARVSAPPGDFKALAGLCRGRPGAMGLVVSDDNAILEFMLTLVWAFGGKEFELEDPGTKKALSYLASVRDCVVPYSENYDAQGLADALSSGEVDFAIAGFDAAYKLWEDGSLNHEVAASPMPGKLAVAFTGTYLAVNRASKTPNAAFQAAFFLAEPDTCGKIINSGLWLCALPYAKVQPPPGRSELFRPFLESSVRLKPAPANVDFGQLAEIYREIFSRIVFKGESFIVVGADMRLKLITLEQGP